MRNTIIDQMKGVGIILMLIGHLFIPYLGRFIYSFHMPLFFLASGYVFRKASNSETLWKLFKRLIIPYFVLGFLFLIYYVSPIEALKSLLAAECWGMRPCIIKTTYTVGILWFLPCMFFSKLFYNIIADNKYVHIIVLVLFTAGWIVGKNTHLPLCLSEGCTAMIFIHLGYMYKLHEQKIDNLGKYKKYIYIICIPLTIACLPLSYTEVGTSSYKFYLLDVIVACFINYLIYKFLRLNVLGRFGSALTLIGKYSYQILCAHVFMGILLLQFGLSNPHDIVYASLSIILPIVVGLIISKTPINYFFKL